MTAQLKLLSLVSFRGATQRLEVTFDTTRPVALIFGENGTGKSTIGDSLDFICNGRFGSLDDRTMSGQPKSHVASLGHDSTKLRVDLVTTVGNFTATLSKNGPVIVPSSGCPDARILRRTNVLELLDQQPKQRFEALKAFIAVPGIERSENALREAHRDVQVDYDEAVRSSGQASDELGKLWDAEGRPWGDPFGWADSEVAKASNDLRNSVDELGRLLFEYDALENGLTALDSALVELDDARQAHANAKEVQEEAEEKDAVNNVVLLRLLEDARDYVLPRKTLRNCPVCEQDVVAEQLLERLSDRIIEMGELSGVTARVANTAAVVDARTAVVAQVEKSTCERASVLSVALKANLLKDSVELGVVWPDVEEFRPGSEATPEQAARVRDFWAMIGPNRARLQERKSAAQKSVDQRNAIKGLYDTYREKLRAARTLSGLATELKQALDVVSHERKAYVEAILATVADEVERLYTRLHPGEGIGKIRFFLKPKAIGSLEFDAQFQGVSEIPPQAYYSESHLDTLGICVFLSLAKHFKTEKTIIVLDDVVTSVDGPHLDRFMDLLHEEAPNFNQVIVTTHYRPWKDRYRYARGPTAKTQVIELRPWTLTGGIQTDEPMTLFEELASALDAGVFDRQSVASKAGIQLENLLDFLTLQYRCKVPRQADPNYTLGDLAAGIDSKLGKYLTIAKPSGAAGAKTEVLLKPLIDECTAQTWVRNRAGCHFHSLGSETTDTDVRAFASKVLALTEAMVCPTCQTLPTRRPSGSFWQCECGALEMHPLISPSAGLGTVAQEL
jgi:hypothetical protein